MAYVCKVGVYVCQQCPQCQVSPFSDVLGNMLEWHVRNRLQELAETAQCGGKESPGPLR